MLTFCQLMGRKVFIAIVYTVEPANYCFLCCMLMHCLQGHLQDIFTSSTVMVSADQLNCYSYHYRDLIMDGIQGGDGDASPPDSLFYREKHDLSERRSELSKVSSYLSLLKISGSTPGSNFQCFVFIYLFNTSNWWKL